MPAAVAKTIDSYADLISAIRARADDMQMTREELDEQAGLQSGYAGKLLGPKQKKHLGMMSLGSTLGALGLQMVLIEDTAQTAKILARRKARQRPIREPKGEPESIERALDSIDDIKRIVSENDDG